MRSFVCLAFALAGCGTARFRTESVGVVPLANGGSVTLTRGNYKLAMRFDVPRAQLVEWTVRCPDVERTGIAGETFEDYRTHRLAELQRMVEEDRRRLAAVTNAVGGGAAVQLRAPGVRVSGEARTASGEVVAEQAIADIHELPYGDVGAGTYTATVHLQTLQDGTCTLGTKAIDPIGGTLAVDRIRDLRAEEQERMAAQQAITIDARARVRTRLVAFGADEHARERRIAEEARRREQERIARAKVEEEKRLRLEAEARLKWEAEAPERERRARLEAERQAALEAQRVARESERRAREAEEQAARRARMAIVEKERLERIRIVEEERRTRIAIIERERAEVRRVRGMYIEWLVGTCKADPHRRARLEAERLERTRRIEVERVERTRRIEIERSERERRISIENARRAREIHEREQHSLQLALSVRTQLTGYLVSAGARMRPPRPELIVEVAGLAPFEGARWEPGTWVWMAATWQWQWRKGGWIDSTQFGDAGGEVTVRARVDAPVTTTTATTVTTESRPSTTVTTETRPSTTVVAPAGITVEVPGTITIDVRPPSPAPKRKPSRVRDHRR